MLVPTSVKLSDVGDVLCDKLAPALHDVPYSLAVASSLIYALARVSQRTPTPEEIEAFIIAATDLLNMYAATSAPPA